MILDIFCTWGNMAMRAICLGQHISISLRAYATKFGGKGTTFYDTCYYFERKKN